ncbi:hypothetical protein [Pseudomonas sp. 7-41]|uniref:hypothetical protein n=1 Tax=Pseudomonas sp. 7-41 TaxID=2898483 RepID=UPI001E5D948F|nr:hypothetical protein [Pseudomonas sp. 7-41]UHG95827.1 hypothetical protein LQ249_19235 [Pseudomonas sp. 7-41]
MKDRSEILGGLITGAYLAGVATLVFWKRTTIPELELNEIGDFLAGVFGPVAFLWLVLGYLQQGRELKLSSEALQLQAQELKNSVEQQKELVDITRLQVESEMNRLRSIQERREKDIMPELFARVDGTVRIGQQCFLELYIGNDGATIFKVSIDFGGDLSYLNIVIPEWPKGKFQQFAIKFDLDDPAVEETVTIAYKDADHNTKVAYFDIRRVDIPGESDLPQFEAQSRVK